MDTRRLVSTPTRTTGRTDRRIRARCSLAGSAGRPPLVSWILRWEIYSGESKHKVLIREKDAVRNAHEVICRKPGMKFLKYNLKCRNSEVALTRKGVENQKSFITVSNCPLARFLKSNQKKSFSIWPQTLSFSLRDSRSENCFRGGASLTRMCLFTIPHGVPKCIVFGLFVGTNWYGTQSKTTTLSRTWRYKTIFFRKPSRLFR